MSPDETTFAPGGRSEATTPVSSLPAAIGRYRILSLLGEGGMGAVYEAEQESPRRTVALKVIKCAWATRELIRRFEQESQLLARLQHPGIAQVYEAGTADTGSGLQPYFAMELITRARPLTEFAEEQHLSVRRRLELTAEVCDAVHHAHQRGIIHRDLKPRNILVDEGGHPKILDFGVARMTDSDVDATRQTDIGQLVGTLAYMSPEQALADPLELDTRSDVYSLGVILYELLAGKLPYQLSNKLHEAVATIREQDPAALSSVNRTYRGDIETIAARAIEKDKARRYASAADLAADIRRHLKDEPIVARPASTVYQLQKFTRRHKALVTGVAAVFIVLAGGIVVSALQATRARRAEQSALRERDDANTANKTAVQERDRAQKAEQAARLAETQAVEERNKVVIEKQRADTAAATAQAVNDFLQNDLLALASSINQGTPNNKPDPDMKVRDALNRAATGIGGKFGKQPQVEASIRQTIGDSYKDLGLYPEAQQQMERALEVRRRLVGEKNPDTLTSMNKLVLLYIKEGKYAQAEPLLKEAQDLSRRILGPEHRATLASLGSLGSLYYNEGKFAQAEPVYEEVLRLRRKVLGEENPDTLTSMNNLVNVYTAEGKLEQAEPIATTVLDLQRRVLGKDHPFTLISMNNLATIYSLRKRFNQSEPLLTEAAESQRRVLGEEHPDRLAILSNLANVYRDEEKYPQAEQLYTKVLDAQRRRLGDEHPDTLYTMENLGSNLARQQRYAEAEAILRQALKGDEKTRPETWRRYWTQSFLGESLSGEKEYAEAEQFLVQSYEGLVQMKTKGPDRVAFVLATGEKIVALYENWGKPEKAAEWREKLRRSPAANASGKP